MYLKKIEIQGFKSFADKTVLEFKPGITAVIGPNGSGKSNVSDAIRWVLGEQSIKALRGSKLEDVIFAGTEARRSVSFAEVNMTIDNQDAKLPVEYTEVTITRRIYRNGESEFYINNNQCRLKDIVELFMDTGIGRDGYSIIGQGRIDEILSSKSEERRKIFEEAAGIVKYRTRKDEAERKLENTSQNLVRINDIVREIEGQLEPLEEQSEKAKKYLVIRENLKHLEVGLFVSNINKGKTKLEEILAQVNEINSQICDEEKRLESLQELKNSAREVGDKLTEDIERVQGSIFELQNSIEKQRADIGIYTERIQHNKENYEKFSNEIVQYEEKKNTLGEEISDRNSKKDRLFKDKQRFEEELKEKEEKYKQISENLTGEQKKIEKLKNEIMQNIDLKFEKMETLGTLNSNLEATKRRIIQIDTEVSDNIHDIDKAKMKKEDQVIIFSRISSEREKLKEKVDAAAKVKLEYNDKMQEYEENIRKILAELNIKESRRKFLIEMENEFEGYAKSVKDILSKCKKDKEFGKNICGALANLVTVPNKYETAIEMALGASLQNIVTETEEDAKNAIEFLKSNNLGRASFLPITAIKENKLSEKPDKMKGFVGVASELIGFDKKYENVIKNLLGRTVIIDNIENAIEVSKKYKQSFRIVTLDGDIMNTTGQMTGGSTTKRTTSILSRAREISELEKIVSELTNKRNQEQKSMEEYKQVSQQTLMDFENIESKLQEVNITYATENEKMITINNEIDRISKKNSILNGEKEKLKEQIEKDNKNISEIQDIIAKIEEENSQNQGFVNEFANKNIEQQKVIDELNSDIMDLKISVSSFEESNSSIDEIIQRINIDITTCIDGITKRKEDMETIIKENEDMQTQIDGTDGRIADINKNIGTLENQIGELKTQREKNNLELLEAERGIEDIFKTLDILKEQNNKLDVKKTKIEAEIENIQNKMWEDYETTPNTAQDYAEVTPSTVKEVDKYKKEIKNLGNININAIEEYKALKDRHEFLMVQKNDLEESEKALNKIIEDMIELMKIQFAKQFEVINKNFGEVFVELFGGGRAELRLADETDILQSGIEIEVQPPGKKLQNMMLLSGGERALTAIALLFAILKINPSPFCILDEIEAALDDINVYRYADYLKKFAKETQFLIITHRKGTMEVANTIYGVTMQEHGISNLYSMKLS